MHILQATLEMLTMRCSSPLATFAPTRSVFWRCDQLALSLAGNPINLLTVTAANATPQELAERPLIVLMSRVHPGESNSSWMVSLRLRL